MKKSKKNSKNRVYFIGIGGISMSALAKLTAKLGHVVAGSDAHQSEITNNLNSKIQVFYGHHEENIKSFSPNLVVFTGAIKPDNEEFLFAINNNIPVIERSEYLGEICKNYKHVIAISGTHGKTTTTAMIGEIFIKAGLKPTIHVGGEVVNLGGNLVVGEEEFFITEACEYKKSFEKIASDCAVVTNIEPDHMDCYEDIADLKNSFVKFINSANKYVINEQNDVINLVNKKECIIVGFNEGNYVAKNLKNKKGIYFFDVYENNVYIGNFKLNVIGEYNVKNALFAIAVARSYNIPIAVIHDALFNFCGVKRRNELLGEINGIPVFADYCHHPTEIANSIKAFKQIYKNIYCVFQPHTYTRTRNLIKEFSTCFKGVKFLHVYKTYPAREPYLESGSEVVLFKHVKNSKKKVTLIESVLLDDLKQIINKFDCILILGAGDLYEIVKENLFVKNKNKD